MLSFELNRLESYFQNHSSLHLHVIPKLADKLSEYNINSVQQLALLCSFLCKQLKAKITYDNLVALHQFTNMFISTVDSSDYKVHHEMSTAIGDILFECFNNEELTEVQRSQLFIYAIDNYSNLGALYSMLGLPGEAYNILTIAVDPPIGGQIQPIEIWNNAIEIHKILQAKETIIALMTNLFYVCRILGTNFAACHEYYRLTSKWIKLGQEADEDDVNYLCYYSGILSHSIVDANISRTVVETLKRQFYIEEKRKPDVAVTIAECLTTRFGLMMGEPVRHWADLALSLGNNLHPQQKATLTITYLLHKSVDDVIQDQTSIKNCLMEYLLYLTKNTDVLGYALQRFRLSELVNRVIRVAVNRKQYRFALECALIWRTFDGDKYYSLNDTEQILMVMPVLDHSEILYILWDTMQARFISYSSGVGLLKLMEVKNKFEGTTTIVVGQDVPSFLNTDQDPYMSNSYQAQLEGHFHAAEIASEINKSGKRLRVLDMTWLNVPLTGLIGMYSDVPISNFVSGQLASYSSIQNVLIWCDPKIPYAKEELEAITEVLSNSSIPYECYKENVDEFLSEYANEKYDLVWIISHGSFNYDNPADSHIILNSKNEVPIDTLINCIPEKKRRLLVLNACKSGCSSIRYDGMGLVGFGPNLTSKCQSVLGNLWAVSSLSSAVFGTILMSHLVEGQDWAMASNNSKRQMRMGRQHVSDLLSNQIKINSDSPLIKEMALIDTKMLFHWAPATLFE